MVVAVILIDAIAVIVVLLYVHMHVCRVADGGADVFAFLFSEDSNPSCSTRPQRFKPPSKVRGKCRAEFTNVFKSFRQLSDKC